MNDDPLAYFLTWTCYGTWLPGDERGWERHGWERYGWERHGASRPVIDGLTYETGRLAPHR